MTRQRSARELAAIHANKLSSSNGRRVPASRARPPYRHGKFTLHQTETANGTTLYFFRTTGKRGAGKAIPLPSGHKVHENARTGLPYLAKSADRQDRQIIRAIS